MSGDSIAFLCILVSGSCKKNAVNCDIITYFHLNVMTLYLEIEVIVQGEDLIFPAASC